MSLKKSIFVVFFFLSKSIGGQESDKEMYTGGWRLEKNSQ